MIKVTGINLYKSPSGTENNIKLFWDSDGDSEIISGIIGFGCYDLNFDNDEDGGLVLRGFSECMDSNDDKRFLKALF